MATARGSAFPVHDPIRIKPARCAIPLALLMAVWVFAGLGSGDVRAQVKDEGILTAQFENDAFANSDDQFTHGMRIAYMAPEDHVPEWAKRLADLAPPFDAQRSKRAVYGLSQSIFTPSDISIRALIPDDRPYAGWLNFSVGLISVGDSFLDNLELGIGVVGPASFAEDVQKTWHEWFGFQRPQGWHHQIGNEPALQINFERKWRALWKPFGIGGLGADVTPHAGINLGNVLTQGAAGLTLRIGDDLPNDYGPPRIRPSLPGSDYFITRDAYSWYVFVGAEARAVAHNIFLDGNTFRDSHSVDKKHVVADFQAGIAVIFGGVRFAYTQVFRTREFHTPDAPEQFGALSVSVKF